MKRQNRSTANLVERHGKLLCPLPELEWAKLGQRVYFYVKNGQAVMTETLVRSVDGRVLSSRVRSCSEALRRKNLAHARGSRNRTPSTTSRQAPY